MSRPPTERISIDRRHGQVRRKLAMTCMASLLLPAALAAAEPAPPLDARLAGLVAAYPEFLEAVAGNSLVWHDGTRMTIDDGQGPRSPEQVLDGVDIKDMFHWHYPAGAPIAAPGAAEDPGRPRHAPLFEKMYGDCRKGETQKSLVEVVWLPRKFGQRLQATAANGVAGRLRAVSAELDELPASFDRFLYPAAGTFNCRTIAGTGRPSPHGYGIAIDIAVGSAHYWRWGRPGKSGQRLWRNAVPAEIVAIFERHGFIWGGRWHHYDTMHFEYRPELIGPQQPRSAP
ncbi:MAG: M15 family metallopeptidase [Hyphomicrobiaceae bacterium]|nr:M15 family metallopeptidase [Hyphomicrobiaceae bacterium]